MQALIPFPNISPELFSISIGGFDFALRWYALAYMAGILIGWRMATALLKRPALWHDQPPMTPRQLEDLLTWIILGIILGGRLGFVLFYQPGYYLQNPAEILRIWQGGMAFHGGLLGVVIVSVIFIRRHQIYLPSAADVIAFAVPPGLFLGRIANFINGELWGRPTDLPWGVAFPGPAAQFCPTVEGICARHPSQLYEALLEGLILGLLLLWLIYRRGALKTPGLVTGLFFAGYGIARFLVEFVRQPDAQFISEGNPLGLAWHINGIGLTMGQFLSLPMILFGLWCIWWARRKRPA